MAQFPARVRSRNARPFAFGVYGVKAPASGGLNTIAVALSSISSGVPGATSATITWTTVLPSTSRVDWGTTTSYLGATSPLFDPSYVTAHSITITGLVTATLYHYRVGSAAGGGLVTFSTDQTFTTA
jgi:hypothetical protein